MKYIWLIFVLFLIVRAIWRIIENSRGRGRDVSGDLPREELPPAGRLPARTGERRKPDLPGYLTRRSGSPGAETSAGPGQGAGPHPDGEPRPPGGTVPEVQPADAVERHPLPETACPERPREHRGGPGQPRARRRDRGNALCPEDVLNGIVWSQILGPRGGLQAQKRQNAPSRLMRF
ncbi:MAG: hypothetical protein K6T80_02245 [Firmicutes bacterium]|nr:hypothetical protein [Bacillota bacterium]